jgi:hypothetical protein
MGNSKNNVSYPEEPLHIKKIKRPEKVAGREYNSIIPNYQENIFVKSYYSHAYDLHILTPLPESQFTDVFIFLTAVQVLPFCHHR